MLCATSLRYNYEALCGISKAISGLKSSPLVANAYVARLRLRDVVLDPHADTRKLVSNPREVMSYKLRDNCSGPKFQIINMGKVQLEGLFTHL